MKPNYLFIYSATLIFGVRKNIIYLTDQLIMISHRRCEHDANISLTWIWINRRFQVNNLINSKRNPQVFISR